MAIIRATEDIDMKSPNLTLDTSKSISLSAFGFCTLALQKYVGINIFFKSEIMSILNAYGFPNLDFDRVMEYINRAAISTIQ
jgi:hypothetical protein